MPDASDPRDRLCSECGAPFWAVSHNSLTCSPGCSAARVAARTAGMLPTDAAMLDALRLMLGFAPLYTEARGEDQCWFCDSFDRREKVAAKRGWSVV